jgi:hypothetical protein
MLSSAKVSINLSSALESSFKKENFSNAAFPSDKLVLLYHFEHYYLYFQLCQLSIVDVDTSRHALLINLIDSLIVIVIISFFL